MSKLTIKDTEIIRKALKEHKITDFQIYGDDLRLLKLTFFKGYESFEEDSNSFSKMKMGHHGHPENMLKVSILKKYLADNDDLSKFSKFVKENHRLITNDFEFQISKKTIKLAKECGISHFSISPDKKTVSLWDLDHHEDFFPRNVRLMKVGANDKSVRFTPCFQNEVFGGLSNVKFKNISELNDLVKKKKNKKINSI
jgi:hypothetical protein